VVDIMLGIFETSLIMTGAILLLSLLIKLLGRRISAAGRHKLWVLIALAMLVPMRPVVLPIIPVAFSRAAESISSTGSPYRAESTEARAAAITDAAVATANTNRLTTYPGLVLSRDCANQ